jgi:proline iminopeptidase
MTDDTQELQLFPPIEPYRSGMLPVDDLHTLYWEESGNPDGVPVVYVHGGPGGGASPEKRQWFDPAYYRIVLYDQRAAFRSTPLGESRDNTTRLLVQDMEALRRMLGIERWLVAGGSWGTTLSLAYGQTHPEACLGFVLRGIFLGSAQEIDWFLHGMGLFYPKAHDDFVSWIPEAERTDILAAYEKKLFGDDHDAQMEIARRWFEYSENCATLETEPETVAEALKNERVVYGTGRLDCFYFCNKMFLDERQLLTGMQRIAHLPAVIVQGAHDVIAPPQAAYRLHQAWPGSVLHMVPDAGHAPSQPGIQQCLLRAIRQYSQEQRFS